MKNSRKSLSILSILFIVATLALVGCAKEPEDVYGSLTINDSPSGYSFIVLVYPSGILPTTYAEYTSMTTGSIAGGSGASPVKLGWPGGTKSGNYLVTIISGSIKKMVIGNFNSNGNATVNWNNMPDVPSYSSSTNNNNNNNNNQNNNNNNQNADPGTDFSGTWINSFGTAKYEISGRNIKYYYNSGSTNTWILDGSYSIVYDGSYYIYKYYKNGLSNDWILSINNDILTMTQCETGNPENQGSSMTLYRQ